MSYRVATGWVTLSDFLEAKVSVPYSVSPYRPATYLDPPEGGPEFDGEPWVCELTLTDNETFAVKDIQPGSIIDLHIWHHCDISEEQLWQIVTDDLDDRHYADEAACEAKWERKREEQLTR